MSERELENRVGFLPRLSAYMLDVAGLWILAVALHAPLVTLFPGAVSAMVAQANAHPDASQLRPFLEWSARLVVAITLLGPFYGLIEAFTGRSPGKYLLGLRITGMNGEKPPLSRLFLRYAIKSAATIIAVPALLLSSKGLGVLAQATSWANIVSCLLVLGRERTAMHDRMAGTIVLR
jgi:uncharacterized RDD family membrane protein YckC